MLKEAAKIFAAITSSCFTDANIDTLFMGMKDVEIAKLFTDTYLAFRVSYFNELDIYVEVKGLDSKVIIKGVGFLTYRYKL